jgi:hypothetical protein
MLGIAVILTIMRILGGNDDADAPLDDESEVPLADVSLSAVNSITGNLGKPGRDAASSGRPGRRQALLPLPEQPEYQHMGRDGLW